MQKKWEWPSKRKTIPKEKVLKLELEGRDIAKEVGEKKEEERGVKFLRALLKPKRGKMKGHIKRCTYVQLVNA